MGFGILAGVQTSLFGRARVVIAERQQAVLAVEGMTCGGCSRRVEGALTGVAGVAAARADLASGKVQVVYDPARVSVEAMRQAVQAAGYVPGETMDEATAPGEPRAEVTPALGRAGASRRWLLPAAMGLTGALGLLALYVAIVGLAQGFGHALELLWQDRLFVSAIAAGFGTQIGLYTYVRRSLRRDGGVGSSTALAASGTGTSSLAMVACCAHHLTDVLPLVGLSGAALFLSDYRIPLMSLGIATNLAGIAVMVRRIRREACHADGGPRQDVPRRSTD